jgi:hypothetical protein
MIMKLPLTLLLAGSALLAQSPLRLSQEPSVGGPAKSMPPVATPDPLTRPSSDQLTGPVEAVTKELSTLPSSTRAAIAALRPTEVLFDRPIEGGELWALGANYKASFAGDRWSFVPQPAADAPAASPLQFRLQHVLVGGQSLQLGSVPAASRVGSSVRLDRGSVVEAIDLSLQSVEQTFTFATLPNRGELVVSIGIDSQLAGVPDGRGLRFRDAWNDVTYSGAVAIDADGDRVQAATELVDGGIRIRVPPSFVATATLPLVIDPVIAQTIVQTGAVDVGNPDIVHAPSLDQWHVSYNQFFANGDWDCYVQRLDAAFAPVGTRTTIDFSGANVFRPKIAHVRAGTVSLVVAENRLTPVKVIGRLMNDLGATTTAQFDIGTATVDCSFPDVGGDPFPTFGYFTVVYDLAYSATDHDVYCRQVETNGVLRGTGPLVIQGNGLDQRNPSISKSCGTSGFPQELHFIVYQEQISSQWDIHGVLLTFSGSIIPVGGANTFPIDTSLDSHTWPQVSTPTAPDGAGTRLSLVAYTNNSINGGDIDIASVDASGNVLRRDNLVALEGRIVAQPWPQGFASVDSDGSRFVVAYQELFGGSGSDFDTRVALVAAGSGELFATGSAGQGFSGAPEFSPQVGSRYSSTGVQSDTVGLCNDYDSSPTFRIEADLYQGVPFGLFGQRTTACGGGVSIGYSGNAIPGGSVTFTLANLSPIAGFAAGEQASTPIPGCPSCILGVTNYTTLFGNSLPVNIPTNLSLIGARLSVQGWMLGNPTPTSCFGSIHFSDSIDLVVR